MRRNKSVDTTRPPQSPVTIELKKTKIKARITSGNTVNEVTRRLNPFRIASRAPSCSFTTIFGYRGMSSWPMKPAEASAAPP